MRTLRLLPLLLLPLTLAPVAQAAPCTTKLDALCEIADEYSLNRLFGDWADIGAIFVGLLLVVSLLTGIMVVVRGLRGPPRVASKPRDAVKELSPGEVVQLIVDVENRRRRTSVDVGLDVVEAPDGWDTVRFGASAFASGFTAPQALADGAALHLSSRRKGNHRGAVAVALTAPKEAKSDESHEVVLRLVPITGGIPRMGRARKHKFTLLVNAARPIVQISNVTHNPSKIIPGRPVTSRVVVINEGNADAIDQKVEFRLNDKVLESKTVARISVKQTATVEFNWTPVAGENRIRVHLA